MNDALARLNEVKARIRNLREERQRTAKLAEAAKRARRGGEFKDDSAGLAAAEAAEQALRSIDRELGQAEQRLVPRVTAFSLKREPNRQAPWF